MNNEIMYRSKKAITIIVDDQYKQGLCDTLKERYASDKWYNVILCDEYDDRYESEIYIIVGENAVVNENTKKIGGIVIDLSDSIIGELIDYNMDLSTVRIQLLDGITLLKDTLIGIDFEDLKDVLKKRDNISVSIVNSRTASDIKMVIEKLIRKTQIDILKCKSVYLYIEGDIGLIEANELAKELESVLGNHIHIAFTAAYDLSRKDEYYIMGLFAS